MPPFAKLDAYCKRMGWDFKWMSSAGIDFNHDYRVSFSPAEVATGNGYYNYVTQRLFGAEMPGLSVFHKDPDGRIFHTYSSYGRGLDALLVNYEYLHLVPKGRDEAGQKPHPMAWVRRHDEYARA